MHPVRESAGDVPELERHLEERAANGVAEVVVVRGRAVRVGVAVGVDVLAADGEIAGENVAEPHVAVVRRLPLHHRHERVAGLDVAGEVDAPGVLVRQLIRQLDAVVLHSAARRSWRRRWHRTACCEISPAQRMVSVDQRTGSDSPRQSPLDVRISRSRSSPSGRKTTLVARSVAGSRWMENTRPGCSWRGSNPSDTASACRSMPRTPSRCSRVDTASPRCSVSCTTRKELVTRIGWVVATSESRSHGQRPCNGESGGREQDAEGEEEADGASHQSICRLMKVGISRSDTSGAAGRPGAGARRTNGCCTGRDGAAGAGAAAAAGGSVPPPAAA